MTTSLSIIVTLAITVSQKFLPMTEENKRVSVAVIMINGDSMLVTKAAVLKHICQLIVEVDDSQSLVISTISPMQHCN